MRHTQSFIQFFSAAMAAAVATTVLVAASNAHAGSTTNISASMNISEDVSAEETGLNLFPGARLLDKNRDGDGANLQFSIGGYGAKLVVAKMRADASPEEIAAFYKTDLARFGDVLDCTKSSAIERRAEHEERKKHLRGEKLTCKGETAPRDGMLFRAGTKTDQRVVSISPSGGGTEFTLVHVNLRLPEWMKSNISIGP